MNSNSKQILGMFQNLTQISTQIKIASFTDALAIIRFLTTTRNNLQNVKFSLYLPKLLLASTVKFNNIVILFSLNLYDITSFSCKSPYFNC